MSTKPVSLGGVRQAAAALKEHASRADADGDGVLTRAEVKAHGTAQGDGFAVGQALQTMQNWARVGGTGPVSVERVQAKIDAAVEVISARDRDANGQLDAGAELRSARTLKTFQVLRPLVAPEATPFALTRAAVEATRLPELVDHGTTLGLETFPASRSRASVLRELAMMQGFTDAEVEDAFSVTRGAKAVPEFAALMRDVGALQREEAETPALGERLESVFLAVAEAATAELGQAALSSVELATHGIEADGDVESQVLLGKQPDGRWVALTYQDNPF